MSPKEVMDVVRAKGVEITSPVDFVCSSMFGENGEVQSRAEEDDGHIPKDRRRGCRHPLGHLVAPTAVAVFAFLPSAALSAPHTC